MNLVAAGGRVLVAHAGALGDFVLTWPLLRALKRGGAEVVIIAAPSHAALAERVLGLRGLGSERREFSQLWREDPAEDELRGAWSALLGPGSVDALVTFIVDDTTDAGCAWCRRARAATGARAVVCAGAPGSAARARVWASARVPDLGAAPAGGRPDGPLLVHVGAGAEPKRWPMECWGALVEELRAERRAVRVLAGPVELERFSESDCRHFAELGGEMVQSLLDLAPALGGGAAFIGADTGPTHLAAQLGVPTLALFGPTDPAVWAPVGPRVEVRRAPGGEMRRLSVPHVRSALAGLMVPPGSAATRSP